MNAPSTTTASTARDECAVFLEVLRKLGLRVGPRERIRDFERWAIKEHKAGLLELLAAEAGVQA